MCSCCDKKKAKYINGMCKACYSKAWRNTNDGKEKTNAYNRSQSAKDAQKRYREKKKLEKPPKPPKPNCECGKTAFVKGLCKSCYAKYVYLKTGGYKKPKLEMDIVFKVVLGYVKKGFTIQESCKIANIDTSVFYRSISENQKVELKACKMIGFQIEDSNELY